MSKNMTLAAVGRYALATAGYAAVMVIAWFLGIIPTWQEVAAVITASGVFFAISEGLQQ